MRGSAAVHADGEILPLQAGDIYLFNSQTIHAINQTSLGNLCLILQFSPDIYADIYKTHFSFSLSTHTSIGIDEKAITLFRVNLVKIALCLHERPNGYPFFARSLLYEFVGTMFQHLQYEVRQAARTPLDSNLEDFDQVKRYIKQNYTGEISQERLCKDLGISRAQLYRILNTAGKDSYKSLINFYRVEYAKELLRSTKQSIPYIATVSGFKSDSSFYRVFREQTALSPRQYRDNPQTKYTTIGVQGYVDYSQNEALEILHSYVKTNSTSPE